MIAAYIGAAYLYGSIYALDFAKPTLFKSSGLTGVMMLNRLTALCLLPLVFFFSDVSSIFEIVKYLVGYSLALYIISTLSILFLGWQSLIKYLKISC